MMFDIGDTNKLSNLMLDLYNSEDCNDEIELEKMDIISVERILKKDLVSKNGLIY